MSPKKYPFVNQVPEAFYNELLDEKKKRVAVLGAFDTWPYMHNICVELVKLNHVAVTSRYIYRKNKKSKTGYYRVPRDTEDMGMNDFLKEKVIEYCNQAVIIYSVPAAHYNEADWCSKIEGYKTLGITFVRKINSENICDDCVVDYNLDYAYCKGHGDAWDCVDRLRCPFKDQGIAKTQLEYYLNENNNMILICIEKLEKINTILKKYLRNELVLPMKYPFVFEFRITLNDHSFEKLKKLVDKKISGEEEKTFIDYEYNDYYYRPNKVYKKNWLVKNRTIRIREYLKPLKNDVAIYSSELNRDNEGFICPDPFGKLIWFKGTLDRAKKLLEDYEFTYFLQVNKNGTKYILNTSRPYKVYLEIIKVQRSDGELLTYGNSIEIEIWNEGSSITADTLKEKERILDKLNLKSFDQIITPVQEFIETWLRDGSQ